MTMTTQAPTKEQIARIREVAGAAKIDADRLFETLGRQPATRWEASQILGALWKIRNLTDADTPREKELMAQIREAAGTPTEPPPPEEETAMPEPKTKKCADCKEELPISKFRKRGAGRQRVCNGCYDDPTKGRPQPPRRPEPPEPIKINHPPAQPIEIHEPEPEHEVNPDDLTLGQIKSVRKRADHLIGELSLEDTADLISIVLEELAE